MKRTAVIMAGGSGERFWPLSRIRKPKQMLNLISPNKIMIAEAIERVSPLIAREDIYIITSQVLLEPMRMTLCDLPPENIIAEPYKRNTAPCLALAAGFIKEKYSLQGFSPENISMAVLTADQSISPNDKFIQTINSALSYIEAYPVLATIGINPLRSETGYGYIEADGFFTDSDEVQILPVKKFHEKPDYQKAGEYISAGNYLWNSGMFFWKLDVFIQAMINNCPEIGNEIGNISIKYKNKTNIPLPEPLALIDEMFTNFPNISIDYALMEKAGNVVVVKALFDWDDIGAWDALDRIREKDENGNISSGDTELIDIKDSIIINEAKNKMIVSALGFENIVVIATDDAILICPKDRVQETKKIVENIKLNKGDKWL